MSFQIAIKQKGKDLKHVETKVKGTDFQQDYKKQKEQGKRKSLKDRKLTPELIEKIMRKPFQTIRQEKEPLQPTNKKVKPTTYQQQFGFQQDFLPSQSTTTKKKFQDDSPRSRASSVSTQVQDYRQRGLSTASASTVDLFQQQQQDFNRTPRSRTSSQQQDYNKTPRSRTSSQQQQKFYDTNQQQQFQDAIAPRPKKKIVPIQGPQQKDAFTRQFTDSNRYNSMDQLKKAKGFKVASISTNLPVKLNR